jgi:hypothetical protein
MWLAYIWAGLAQLRTLSGSVVESGFPVLRTGYGSACPGSGTTRAKIVTHHEPEGRV